MSAAPYIGNLELQFQRGMRSFAVPPPQTLDQWATEHFYLSETNYVEQDWSAWPFQRAIMAAISDDDIREVTLKKSARIGYTRILLAAIGYFAHHHRRNQILWQPTDEDRDEFVKADLDLMLRDVDAMREVMPSTASRHKDNTMHTKKFLGCILYTKGGKAAKNYRRVSADVGYIDEADAFDRDVEKEGDPFTLAYKRVEGATFPKMVAGSTPKQRGFSLIDDRYTLADERFTFQIPCPHCGGRHPLTWGGKDVPHGFKWVDRNPETVRHLCPHCAALITHGDFLRVQADGVYINATGTVHYHPDGRFTDPDGHAVATPKHVAFHVWTAYNPTVSWAKIVSEFLAVITAKDAGDMTKLKAFTNTTLGECWEEDVERTEADELKQRAEPIEPRTMPRECLLLLCGGDTQDNRVELGVWGYARGGEMWPIDHQVIFGNPALPAFWDEVEDFIRNQKYQHAGGVPQSIHATAIDSGGHHADAVYAFAHKLKALRVHAIKGAAMGERSIDNGNTRVEYKWNGKVEKHGPVLWHVGTNLAKDRFQSRLSVTRPGPGYVHLSTAMSDEWFKQLAGEQRVLRRTHSGSETRWSPIRQRIEVKDCLTYTIWLEERLDLWSSRRIAFWNQLEEMLNPPPDLFTPQPALEAPPPSVRQPARHAPPPEPPQQAHNPFASSAWSSRT